MKQKNPDAAGTAHRGEEIRDGGPLRILPPSQNRNTDPARLGYLTRLVDHQAHDAERFDEMCLAAERYRTSPTSANAVKAHLAARRYGAAA